jgi:endonuclease/exonuclease/phosphatase family metal-dependent hydrolase
VTSTEFRLTPHTGAAELRLERWRRNVGSRVALDLASDSQDSYRSLLVLSWNVWIGQGRLWELVTRLREGQYARLGANRELPLVVLLQEAYRSDASVPETPAGRSGRVLMARLGSQEDVVATARSLGLNLRYAPSMRNGRERSDRGNAILSTLPLTEAEAVELPFVLQRRVAVAASITVAGTKLRLVSAHLDPRGPPGHKWLGAAGRALQAAHLVAGLKEDTIVLGADLNLGRGRSEAAWRLLADAGFALGVPPAAPRWRHTFHALPRLILDYLLIRDRGGIVAGATVHRLDEHPRDRGPRVFGSDHHPLLTRIDFDLPSGDVE